MFSSSESLFSSDISLTIISESGISVFSKLGTSTFLEDSFKVYLHKAPINIAETSIVDIKIIFLFFLELLFRALLFLSFFNSNVSWSHALVVISVESILLSHNNVSDSSIIFESLNDLFSITIVVSLNDLFLNENLYFEFSLIKFKICESSLAV